MFWSGFYDGPTVILGEAKEVALSLKKDCTPFFPMNEVQKIVCNCLSTTKESVKFRTLSKAKYVPPHYGSSEG